VTVRLALACSEYEDDGRLGAGFLKDLIQRPGLRLRELLAQVVADILVGCWHEALLTQQMYQQQLCKRATQPLPPRVWHELLVRL
jgi:hypothetical protein